MQSELCHGAPMPAAALCMPECQPLLRACPIMVKDVPTVRGSTFFSRRYCQVVVR